MAITYPLTPPAALKVAHIAISARSVVASNASPFTLQEQVYVHPGQCWQLRMTLPPLRRANAEDVIAFLLSLNGKEGTFYIGDSASKAQRGSMSGSVTVGSGATARSTVLPFSGTGTPAVGDWWQVGTTTSAKLHKILKVNSGNVDVFPKLRSAYTSGTAITYTNAVGLFRLAESQIDWAIDRIKLYEPVEIAAMEVIA